MTGTPRGHIGFFAYYFPPLGGAGSQRALSFARHLPALGWRVTVITPREGVYGRDPSLSFEGTPGVEVLRTASWEPAVLLRKMRGGGGGGGRTSPPGGDFVEEARLGPVGSALRGLARRAFYFPDSSRGWIKGAVAAAVERHGKDAFDLLLSSSPPVSAHLAARLAARRLGVPLVLDFRDLWPPTVQGESEKAVVLLRGILGAATAAVTVSEGYARWIREFSPGTRVGVVYNGFEPDPDGAGGDAPKEAAASGEPFLVHGGTTYPQRQDARLLVGPLRALREEGTPLGLVMAGSVDGTTRARLAPLIAEGGADLPGFLPHEEVRGILSRARAILVWAWSGDDAIGRGHLPAKLFEALKIGGPVVLLAAPGSEAAALGRTVGLEAVDPADGERLTGVLRELARGRVPPGLVPDPEAVARFRREGQVAELDGVLRAAAGGGGGERTRRLAFFAYYYPPLGGAGSQRALSFARHLSGKGWQVTVFTPREGVYGRDPSLASGNSPGVRIERTGTWEPSVLLRRLRKGSGSAGRGAGAFVDEVSLGLVGRTVRGLVRRTLYFPDSSRGWIGPAVARAREVHAETPFDAVLSSSPPVSAHLAAAGFAGECGIPWIADWRDIWTSRMDGSPRLRERAGTLERELVRRADGICAASEGFVDLLVDRGAGGLPRGAVRNGWEEADFPVGPALPAPAGPVILYAGTVYGRNQDLDGFLRALESVRAGGARPVPRVRFLGKIDGHTRNLVRDRGVEDIVEFKGFVTHEHVVEELRRATALLLLGWRGDHEDAGGIVPAKAYEYLAAGRPILALTDPETELARIVGPCRGVTVAGFDDTAGIGRWIRSVADGTAGEGPRRPEALPYLRSAQVEVLAGILGETMARAGRR